MPGPGLTANLMTPVLDEKGPQNDIADYLTQKEEREEGREGGGETCTANFGRSALGCIDAESRN